uniref:Zinc finger MYM-type protein 4-like n=1 Tax=Sinocyclocheilus rhinocerous TaxID=307959 RepID=A0A673G9F5_9TELE
MASEDSTEQLPGDAAGSEVKPDAVESCLLDATDAGVNEPNLQNNLMESHQMDGPEKADLTDQNEEEENFCSEELVIAKVEDFTNEMAIDVDQTEDRDGRMEKTEPSVVQTQSMLKTELKPEVAQLSGALPVKVKDEPMDEEYEKVSEQLGPVGNIKDEPNTAAVSFNNITAVQDYEIHFLNACPKRCVFNLDLNRESVSEPRTLSGRLFQSLGTFTHEVNLKGSIHKLCSNSCFNQFRSSNKLTMNSCVNCGGYCNGTDSQCPSLQIEGSLMKFCKQNCLIGFKKKSLKPVTCKICRTMRPVAEMVDSPNTEGIRELFCSTSCVTANKVQTVSSSGAPVECNSCKLKLVPQYHLAMSDGTIQNFCSFSCVVSYQESFSKTKPILPVNAVTSTSNNTPTPKPAAPKPASSDSSSSVKTTTSSGTVQTVTKIPCSQCLNSFFHRPELLEFKRKMYAFCDNACVEEFKQINNVMARCEYCKIDKIVKEVKRINKIDRSFCSEGCKLLFKHDLVKRWGKKHCRSCFYCSGSAQTLVTEVVNNVEEEFCGNLCLSQHTLLMRKEIKCSMCRQAKKMTETVKWLGEIKHFCSLQCLMFFCSLQGTTGAVRPVNKPLSTQGTGPAPSPGPQSTVNRTSLITKEATPVIASVISLSSASSGQPGVLGNSVLQGSVPAATAKSSGNAASTQTDGEKASAPAPRILKNKALLCKPLSQNKGTSCKPNVCDMNTQTDGPSVIVLPVPVPIYVPVPMNLYTQYTPKSVGLPLPVPVPLFFPTTLDSAECIVKTIQEIKEKIPDDPLEADLIMMAEMVAEDAEKEKNITVTDPTSNIMYDLDLEALSSNLSWEEDSVSSAQTWDQTPEPERPPLSRSATVTPVSTAAEEPQMDLEADFPIESIELFREQTQKETTDSGKRKSRKRKHDGFPQKKRGRKSATVVPVKSALDNLSTLQHEYAVNAWKEWVRWRNAQPNMETPKFGSRSMTLKEDLLKCCTAELSYGLCKFISEVRRPSGEKYSPDTIFYLCLGIQQYLFKNNRMENIFADVFYTKFCQELTNILRGWKPTILPSGYVHSRVEEEYLWDCKQLGAFSPGVLLNTLLYFFSKYFNYKTAEQHRRLSFGHIVRCSRSKGNTKVACLRFYPPKEDTIGVPAKKRKEEEDDSNTVYEIKENADNPLRCPVRLYEFYLSKCSPSVRQRTTDFYLSPERSCVPNSPMWFSTTSLSDEALDSMLTRILTVRELHLERDKSPNETDSDSDLDFRP